ncbi:MAG: hypothetical protein LBK41_04020 [Clostridiales bacterium]|jgi:hypothetical protein|nr:hypothetical protein [Clostridiales bacterium]
MSKRSYRPDYGTLYPELLEIEDIERRAKILECLTETDRQMEYAEYHRKRGRVLRDKATGEIIKRLPPIECSYDALPTSLLVIEL